jgi:hypothetical protein
VHGGTTANALRKNTGNPGVFLFVRPTWVLEQSGLIVRREQWENALYDKQSSQVPGNQGTQRRNRAAGAGFDGAA